ncbi:unnamed protein product [Pylaiella littoralis]
MCSSSTASGSSSSERRSRSSSTGRGRSRSRSSSGRSSNSGRGGGPAWSAENREGTTSARTFGARANANRGDMPLHASSSPPVVVGATPSRIILRVSIGFALLSVCGAWVFGGAKLSRISESVRVGVSPWLSREQDECRAAPPWDADLSEMRDAVEAFEARQYSPPVWARNAHLHTIVASGDIEKKILGNRTPLSYWRERWPTPDGDFVDIDWLPAEKPSSDSPEDKNSGLQGADADESSGVAEREKAFGVDAQSDPVNGRPRVTHVRGAACSTERMEELRDMAALAERAHDNNLGIGHPAAPEPIHGDDPSWMAERSKGKGGQGTGGTRALVLVLHGLEGSSTAPLTKRFSSVFTRNGFDVAALNFRGCSGELSRFPVGYHLGFTDDLLHVIEEIHRRFPGTWDRIYLSGFSLGGNVIVKFLGEQGDRARALGIYGAAVGCVPFNPKSSAEKLEKDPVGRYVYMPVFLGWMNSKATAHAKAFPEQLSLETVQTVKTFTQFNEHVTSPLFDFSTPEDFYEEVNAANYLSKVRVPLVVVNAKDDPFIDGDSLPEQERTEDAPVRLVYHTYGGHCGFMSGVPSNVSKGKAPSKSSRKWGPPWGGSWVPWASRGDPETLSHDGADYNDDGDNSAAETDVGAAAAAVAEAEAAAVSTARTAAAAAATISGTGGVEGGGGGGGGGDGRDTGEGEQQQQQQQPGRGTAAVKEGRWLPTELARFVRHLEDSIHRDGRSEQPGARAGAASSAGSCVPAPSMKR